MRLLYVCSDFGIPLSGTKGASIHLRAITRALSDLGHEVLLLSPKKTPAEMTAAGGGSRDHPARALLPGGCPPAEQTGRLLKGWLQDRGLRDSVARELRHLIYNAWVHDPALEVLRPDPPDAIVERLSLFGHVGIDLADALNVPLITEVNAPLAEEARAFRSLQLTELASEIEQRVLSRADAIIAVSAVLADHLAAAGVSRRKLHVIPNGVDVALFDGAASREVCRARLDFEDEFVVGFAGSLKDWHGVDVLLAAFALLRRDDPSTRLLIVGTGPGEAHLRKTAAEMNGGESVIFTGAVPHDRVPELLQAMDVAVAPFHQTDSFYFSPVKLFEYMVSGTCVVASRLGQIAEVVQDGVNGLLCAPSDEQDLCAVLKKARRSPDLRRRLGLQAAQTVRAQYTWSHTARATASVIEAVVKGRRGQGVESPCGPRAATRSVSGES